MTQVYPLWSNEEERLRVLQRMRRQLKDEGILAQGVLSSIIEASWMRSVSYGIVPDGAPQTEPSSSASKETELLQRCAEPELEFLSAQYSQRDALILADGKAQVLRISGSLGSRNHACIDQVREGFCWTESKWGTNALGTTLVQQSPVWINSGEHYLDGLAHLSCAAVPIRDPQGQSIGVLNLTREGPLRNPHDSINLLMLSASQIENRLLCATHSGHLVLAIHSRQSYLESAWRGLLAIDGQGRIRAANEQACSLFNRPVQQLLGMECKELLGGSLEMLLTRLNDAPVLEQGHGCAKLYLRCVQWPISVRPRVVPSMTDTPAPGHTARAHTPPASIPGSALGQQFQAAIKVMNAGVPILLRGETGTGKEVAARTLHDLSQRSQRPFVAINCAAIPEGLIESELFGYRDGAFTGARRGGAPGRLLQAHGGTLFLDEIGDMPLSLQARLLRVLQERKVTPLGSAIEVELDVFLVCATHRDLSALVVQQQFRQDLFYRINGLALTLPPLRQRSDFTQLVEHLAQRLAGKSVPIDSEFMQLLQRHDWPGNIRQLEMVLRTALALREDEHTPLQPSHLSEGFLMQLNGGTSLSCAALAASQLQQLQAQTLSQALQEHGGNATAAARSLGFSRATFYRKLRQYGS